MTAGGPMPADRVPRSSEHAWERSVGLWTLTTWICIGLATALAVVGSWGDWRRMVAVLLVSAAFTAWFATVGLSYLRGRRGGRAGLVFVVGMIALQAVALAVSPAFFLLSFATYALCFVMIERLTMALVAVGALSAVVAFSILWWDGTVETALIQGFIVFASASVLGTFISRIIDESQQRADLISTLEATREQLAAANREAGVAAERARLASEIHDTLAQGFTSLLALVRAAQGRIGTDDEEAIRLLRLAESSAAENLEEARGLVAALQPVPLRAAPLDDALRRIAASTGDQTGIEVTVETTGTLRALSPREEVALLRAAQEALANVRRHSRAGHATLRLDYGDTVTLTVTDDGCGFDPADVVEGFGLRGMQSRLDAAGGKVAVVSSPGAGTTVRVTLP